MSLRFWDEVDAPWGRIAVSIDAEQQIVAIDVLGREPAGQRSRERCAAATGQLREYFAGSRRAFELPLALGGTAFQRCVWEALTTIPYGQVLTYGELADRIGRPAAARAVGQANGANPVPIVVPCHRVVASGGRLGGYTGGLRIKQALLALEGLRLAA